MNMETFAQIEIEEGGVEDGPVLNPSLVQSGQTSAKWISSRHPYEIDDVVRSKSCLSPHNNNWRQHNRIPLTGIGVELVATGPQKT